MGYEVFVDDNYHYMDESARYRLGEFETAEEAVAACRKIVDDFLAESHEPGMTEAELVGKYKMFGEDPFVASEDVAFSAWTYAERRAREICGEDPTEADD